MHWLSAKVNRGITPEQKKVIKFKMELGLPFMVPDLEPGLPFMVPDLKPGIPFMVLDLVYKFQMVCQRGTSVIERKSNLEWTHGHMDGHG